MKLTEVFTLREVRVILHPESMQFLDGHLNGATDKGEDPWDDPSGETLSKWREFAELVNRKFELVTLNGEDAYSADLTRQEAIDLAKFCKEEGGLNDVIQSIRDAGVQV
jgi:hypothetical protein